MKTIFIFILSVYALNSYSFINDSSYLTSNFKLIDRLNEIIESEEINNDRKKCGFLRPCFSDYISKAIRLNRDSELKAIKYINYKINSVIRYSTDLERYNVEEHWATPSETFRNRSGDCEDYAIVKYIALLKIGISADRMRFLVLSSNEGQNHAVLAIDTNSGVLVLDNNFHDIIGINSKDFVNSYKILFNFDHENLYY
jgi:predicted transglutaminase-like cysteine proteinase